MASGRPARRRHIAATAGATSAVRTNPGCTSAARSQNSRIAADSPCPSDSATQSGDGNESGRSLLTASPSTPSGPWQVANTSTPAPRRPCAASAAAITTSSQSSSTTSRRPPAAVAAPASREACSSPSVAATAGVSCPGSCTAPRSTTFASAPLAPRMPATSQARRLLPTPGAPVTVTSPRSRTSLHSSATSRSRPVRLTVPRPQPAAPPHRLFDPYPTRPRRPPQPKPITRKSALRESRR